MISLEVAPYFYALSENYGSPEEDYLQAYEALLREGPLHTIDLRNAAKLTNAREAEFTRALELLQADFKILPVGVARAGAWKYAFIYEIVSRHYPDLPEKARFISESEARRKLAELYFESVGAAHERDVIKLFGWQKELSARTIAGLIEKSRLVQTEHPKENGEWLALPGLIR
jgi:hypothetical protein